MKVGKKARRGRKANPVPHKQHRSRGAIGDPLTRVWKRERLRKRRRDDALVEARAWADWR